MSIDAHTSREYRDDTELCIVGSGCSSKCSTERQQIESVGSHHDIVVVGDTSCSTESRKRGKGVGVLMEDPKGPQYSCLGANPPPIVSINCGDPGKVEQRSQEVLSNRSALTIYLVALAAGFLFALWLFPVDFILGKGPRWAAPGGGDLQTNVVGMRYFLADEWRFPLFQTRLIAPPDGVNVIYTDSLPLFALIAKLVQPLLPEQLNYFGIWYFLAYTLQGVAAVFLLRSLSVTGLLPNLAGAIITLSFPAFLYRVWHAALCGHFLVLFALGLYFRTVRQQAFGKVWGWFAILCCFALLVHAYLFLMVIGVFIATATQEAFSSRAGLRRSLVAGTVVAGTSTLLMWVSGHFQGMAGRGGFGLYSMNVLSPWVPQQSGLFRSMDRFIDGTGGQYEGFNYLGFGVLLLLATGLWFRRSEILNALWRYWALGFLLLGFTLLAISHRVFVGKWWVLHIGVNPSSFYLGFGVLLLLATGLWFRRSEILNALWSYWGLGLLLVGLTLLAISYVIGEWRVVQVVLQQFRSSGRLFWPVGYMLMVTGLAMALKMSGPRSSALILTATVLQVIDAGPLRERVATIVRSGAEFRLSAEPWRAIIAGHDRLTVIPSFDCAGSFNRHVGDLVFHASSSATPVNTAYLSRQPAVDCPRESVSLDSRELGEGELLVVLSPPLEKRQVNAITGFETLCRSFAGGFACSRRWRVLEGLSGSLF
jgi:hypothetical protein